MRGKIVILVLLLQCLVTCGKGYKHRQTWCQFGEDRLDDRLCGSAKPESVQTCQQQECASWQVGPWGQVSVARPLHKLPGLRSSFWVYFRMLADEPS